MGESIINILTMRSVAPVERFSSPCAYPLMVILLNKQTVTRIPGP